MCCLKLWGKEKSGPFFTALHLSFGIGNILGPVLAEIFLDHNNNNNNNSTYGNSSNNSNNSYGDFVYDSSDSDNDINIAVDTNSSSIVGKSNDLKELTNLQIMHLVEKLQCLRFFFLAF